MTTVVNKQSCPVCGQSCNIRKITVFKGMVDALKDVFTWCRVNNTDKFSRKNIKHLLDTDNKIARFGDWEMFGLVKKSGKGHYEISINRVGLFLGGKLRIPTVVYKDPLARRTGVGEYKLINEIKGLKDFLDDEMQFIAEYVN